ncbi:cobalamin biosynthesis protein [Alteromonas sp. C1M14]|uniref:cobalamin biosynthesis protein CobD/CbiB n=1 Tax=Alteromonas sp. C1M14 TaxID=2841567 RepID=UPI001C0A10C1|nr:cobalamin biosynthesis protein [Alteromonas sp. C1M14]MBU2979495.1 cobalamin biosynthesis protein [Alteromonas sp. C1M14]
MDAVLSSTHMQTLAIVILAIAINSVWRWPEKYHPLTLFRLLAKGMAQKVKPQATDPPRQHRISGSLGAIVLIAPFVVLVALLVYMAEYPLFFDAIILLCLLDFAQAKRQYRRIMAALAKDQKLLAREILGTIVARDCQRLSDLGIAKAAMESLLLRFYYQVCGVIFWFLIGGPAIALGYRLLLVFSWEWHWRLPGYYWFGLPVRRLARLLAIVPAFIGAFMLAIVTHPVRGFKAITQCKHSDPTSFLLALSGGGLGVKLGGPAIYGGNMVRYHRVGGPLNVKYSDMYRCIQAISHTSLLLCGVIIILMTSMHVMFIQ